ncbi:flagellar basal body-associated protein FliL [Robertmurraya yapensis]|uniref:Flagellar protein FliL n=2 Tax=Bacillaceae TaxID=186817 RepID=A0A431WJ39_9BACI|nr:flagellar basal body-associated protein FliL [Bacillus yapensis]RTR35587.1 flagellar basal body-associated protein FliL [Bacillus yapensis]TKS98388.1 flagellar basal body-associated protein FliL [Bacillus yapensis]
MKNNKLVMIMLIILIAITLVGAVAVVVVLKVTGAEKADGPTIDEVIEASVDIPEITTNLAGNDLIRISFKIETDSKKAKEELEKRDFQVKNIIILSLSEKTTEQIQGSEGQTKLETELKDKINELMQEGKVEKVYITGSLLQ